VTKIDQAEAMAPWRAGEIQLVLLLGSLLLAVSTLSFALWQARSKSQYHLLLEVETARSATAARLAAIVEGSEDAIIATDTEGVITAWNPAAEHMHGYSAAEMIGQRLDRLIPPGLCDGEHATLAVIAGGGWMQPYETVRLTKDGRSIDLSVSLSPILDASGRVVGSSRIGRDITEQKSVRKELERLRWMLAPATRARPMELPLDCPVCSFAGRNAARLILDAAGGNLLAEIAADFSTLMGTCFAVHEANGEVAYSALTSDWGRFLDAHFAPHCAEAGICAPAGCDRWLSQHSPWKDVSLQAMKLGAPAEYWVPGGIGLYVVPIFAGDEVVGSIGVGHGDPIRDPGQLAAFAAKLGVDVAQLERHAAAYETRPPFIVDLAKQRLASSARLIGEIVQRHRSELRLRQIGDELARSNRELEQFAYVASHDLQEPLRMVASYTQLLAHRYRDKLDQDAREFIDYAVDGATRMKQLIEDLLAYSRVASKGHTVSSVDTRNSLALALRNLGTALTESEAEVTSGDLPCVRANGPQIAQVFQNLVGNALKFRTPGVPLRVHIEARRDPGEPKQWRFCVRDNGIGVDPKFFERIFVIFQRLHTRQEYAGTGIGLALCQRIVERHGGRIWIESEPGKGSTFSFTLPGVEIAKGEA
jgi:PAS domain S-box-containing protein